MLEECLVAASAISSFDKGFGGLGSLPRSTLTNFGGVRERETGFGG